MVWSIIASWFSWKDEERCVIINLIMLIVYKECNFHTSTNRLIKWFHNCRIVSCQMQSGWIGIFFFINIITAWLMWSVPKKSKESFILWQHLYHQWFDEKILLGLPKFPNKLFSQFWHPRKTFYFNFLILFAFLSHVSCTYLLQQKQYDFSFEVFSLGVELDSSLIGLSLKNSSNW